MKMLVLATALLGPTSAFAQNDEVGADTDATKPVLYSIRNEYYDLLDGRWQDVTLLRLDRATLQHARLPGQLTGVIVRADIPFSTVSDGSNSTSGLGDAYVQALVAPHISGPDFLAIGMGLIVPTASDDRLGRGKWIDAPALLPVRFFLKKGFAIVS